MSTACQRFFDIPELTASLDPFLSTNDRIHLLTTSRSLHKVFAPLCWSHLDMKPTVTTARLFKSPDGMDALGRYVRSVQSLEASSPFFKTYMESVLAFMLSQRLEGLSLSDTGTGGEGAEAVAGTGTGAVIVPPKWLPPLPIQAMKPETLMPPTPPMRNLTRLNCALTRLDMDGDKLGLRQSFQICWLLRLNPGLTHLNLVNMALYDARLVRVLSCTLAGLPRLKNGPLPNLTRLFMPTHQDGFPMSIIELFLQDCPFLQMWGVPHLDRQHTFREVSALLLRHCPNLRELTCKDGTIRRRDFLEVIRGMPTNQLETLALIR
ncbi:hypothetical protein BGZ91_004204, partial [Linnemannia elongata]